MSDETRWSLATAHGRGLPRLARRRQSARRPCQCRYVWIRNHKTERPTWQYSNAG